MSANPQVLLETAEELLAILKAGADVACWEPTVVGVSSGEPAIECGGISVWASQLQDQGNKCNAVSRVTFTFQLNICVGADINETEVFDSADTFHDVAWAVWVELLQSCCNGTGFGDLVDDVDIGTLRLITNSGGMGVWQGTVTLTQSAEEIVGS